MNAFRPSPADSTVKACSPENTRAVDQYAAPLALGQEETVPAAPEAAVTANRMETPPPLRNELG